MAITLADIDRWDPSAVREVSTALGKRGASADEVRAGLSRLPLIASWQGSGGDAARAALDKLSTHLVAHADEMASVASATSKSADEIEAVRENLQGIYRDARTERFDVDPATGAVTPLDKSRVGDPVYLLEQMDLENRITKVLADGNAADADLARAITMAGNDATGPAEAGSDIRAALSQPPPDDPKKFHDLWDQLTPEEKDWLYQQNPSIGNHGGMPVVDRDKYNRLHLDELAKNNQAELDQLRAQHPDWANGDTPFLMSDEYRNWKTKWDADNHTRDGYNQVNQALQSPDHLPRFLDTIDDHGHAVVSINNPDTATRNATYVPGTGQDLARLQYSTEKSEQMYWAAREADRSLKPGDVSVTTWMGYDRPMNVITDAPSTSYAHNGAQALDDFQAGERASHDDAHFGQSINTVIGHSYGSTLVGAAGLDGHHLDANNVVAVGSPGILAGHASDLNLDPGAHVFATRALNDIIGITTYASLGPDPMASQFGGIPFEASPGPSWLGLPSIDAHSSYWDPGNLALNNLGRIIAGRTDVTPPTFTP